MKLLFRSKINLAFIVLLFGVVNIFMLSDKAQAASLVTNVFPRGNQYIFLSQYTNPGHLLETPKSNLRVFFDTTSPTFSAVRYVHLRVSGYCRGTGDPSGFTRIVGGTMAPGSSRTQAFSTCSGVNDPLNVINFYIEPGSLSVDASGAYGPNYRYIDIKSEVRVSVPLAIKVFAMNAGGLVTMQESPPTYVNSPFGSPIPAATNYGTSDPFSAWGDLSKATALWDNLASDPPTVKHVFPLRFQTPCNIPVGTNVPAFLRWYDADYGQGAQSGSINWRLVNNRTGATVTRSDAQLGGNDEYRELRVNFIAGHEYTWIWEGVSATNGIQVWLPFSEINDTIRLAGDCNVPEPAPVSSYCQITARNRTTGVVYTSTTNRTFDVDQGDDVQIEVFARNSGGTIWNNTNGGGSSLVYFHDGAPTAFTEGNGRIHKYGNNTVAPFDFNHGPVSSGSNSATVVRGAANTNSDSTYTYTVNHLTAYSVATGATWSRLATCTINFNVLPPSYIPGGTISRADCNSIVFTPSWIPNTRSTAMNGQLIINGVSKSFTVNPYVPTTINTFGDPAFANLPLHLGSYNIDLIVEGSSVASATMSGVPCLSISCTTNGNFELGDPSQFNLNYRVQNNTNRTDSRYDVALSNPPGGSIVNPDLAALTGTNYTTSFSPSSSATVTGTLTFNGVSTGLSSNCSVVVLRYPYLKAYGADVAAGGGFLNAGTCPNRKSGILTYMRPINQQNAGSNRSGSGGQFGSFAWDGASGTNGVITGFGSASLRNTNPSANLVNRLTFGGEASPVATTNNSLLGGKLAGNAPCMPDYFGTTAYPIGVNNSTDTRTSIDFSSGNQGDTNRQTTFNQNVAIAGNGAYNIRHTYYVNGDVQINGNIMYPAFSSVASIPNFTIVVKGNIYIGPGVTRLDGTYIAQPLNNGTKGRIYTCATNFAQHTSTTDVFNTCSNYDATPIQQLVVNGSFIADKVVFNRALNTLDNSRFKELAGSSAASEIFNFSPEVYLSPPVFLPRGTITSGDYDAIATLPPIL